MSPLPSHHRGLVCLLTPRGAGAVAILSLTSPQLPEILAPFFRRRVGLYTGLKTPAVLSADLMVCPDQKATRALQEVNPEPTAGLGTSDYEPQTPALLASSAHQHPGRVLSGRFLRCGQILDEGLLFLWPPAPGGSDWRAELHLHGGVRIVEQVLVVLTEAGLHLVAENLPAVAGTATAGRSASKNLATPAPELFSPLKHNRLEVELGRQILHAPTLRGVAWLSRQLAHGLAPAWQQLGSHSGTVPAARLVPLLTRWLENGRRAVPLLNPTPVLLVGPPNAGKSTLFNALLGRSASIVSAVAGTTRDWVDADVELEGLPVHLFDTAGWRLTSDELEAHAVHRVQQLSAEMSHAVYLILLDGSQPASSEVIDRLSHLARDRRTWYVRTHADRPSEGWHWPVEVDRCRCLEVSGLDSASVQRLAAALATDLLPADQPTDEPAVVGEPLCAVVQSALQSGDPLLLLRDWMKVSS